MDAQQQQQITNMMAGMGVAFLLIGLLGTAFVVFLFWRCFTKAGLAGPLSLLALIPGIGFFVVLCILAFSEWRPSPGSRYSASGTPLYPPNDPI